MHYQKPGGKKMIKSPNEELEWLKQLQKDLIEDRQIEKGNASPLYYGIIQPEKQFVPEGYEEDVTYYDPNGSCELTLEEIWNDLDEETKKDMSENFIETGVSETGDGKYEILDKSDFDSYICELYGYEAIPYEMQDRIQSDLMFLTRKSADDYLKQYGYNHPNDARSYAMTAIRSPEYEHLLELLHRIDWENSEVKLRFTIPEHYWNEAQFRNKLYDYVDTALDRTNEDDVITVYHALYDYLNEHIEHVNKQEHNLERNYYDPNRIAYHIEDWAKNHPQYEFHKKFQKDG